MVSHVCQNYRQLVKHLPDRYNSNDIGGSLMRITKIKIFINKYSDENIRKNKKEYLQVAN